MFFSVKVSERLQCKRSQVWRMISECLIIFLGEGHHDLRGEEGSTEPAAQHGVRDEGGHGAAQGDEGGEGAGENEGAQQAADRDPGLGGRQDAEEDPCKIWIIVRRHCDLK